MSELKVDTFKYGKLRDEHVEIFTFRGGNQLAHEAEDHGVTAKHVTGISVSVDDRNSLAENWDLAQNSLNQALEHQENI